MREYEIRVLSNGHASTIIEQINLDDAAALRSARNFAGGRDFEVWRGNDRIHPPATPNPALYSSLQVGGSKGLTGPGGFKTVRETCRQFESGGKSPVPHNFLELPWFSEARLVTPTAAGYVGPLVSCLRRWDRLPSHDRARAFIVLDKDGRTLTPVDLGRIVSSPEYLSL